jgi:hypothetical protein
MIGNKRTRLYHTVLDVDCNDGSVQLPCNADMIEAVTRLGEDYQKTGNSIAFDNYNSSFTEGYIESRKTDKGPLYISGGLVKYTQTEDKIFVNPSIGKVRILYHGIELDDDGLPRITDKEAIAIAHYVAYIFSYKKSLLTNNPNTM